MKEFFFIYSGAGTKTKTRRYKIPTNRYKYHNDITLVHSFICFVMLGYIFAAQLNQKKIQLFYINNDYQIIVVSTDGSLRTGEKIENEKTTTTTTSL